MILKTYIIITNLRGFSKKKEVLKFEERTLTCSRWRLLKASTVSRSFRQQGVSYAVQRTLKKKYTTVPSEPRGAGGQLLSPDTISAYHLNPISRGGGGFFHIITLPTRFSELPTALPLDNKVYFDAIRFNELVL